MYWGLPAALEGLECFSLVLLFHWFLRIVILVLIPQPFSSLCLIRGESLLHHEEKRTLVIIEIVNVETWLLQTLLFSYVILTDVIFTCFSSGFKLECREFLVWNEEVG